MGYQVNPVSILFLIGARQLDRYDPRKLIPVAEREAQAYRAYRSLLAITDTADENAS